ncbi:hypothetical protein VZT92_005640 [Zoarces viviparus]|uniref:Uncharacterized protein n=1 Tax=Zoarces viviparus TaxID=48416 RepID=A0AAW1FV65_ZOAVI
MFKYATFRRSDITIWLSFNKTEGGHTRQIYSKLNSQVPYLCRVGAKRCLAGCQESGPKSRVDPQADNGALERDMSNPAPRAINEPLENPLKKDGKQTKIIRLRDDLEI